MSFENPVSMKNILTLVCFFAALELITNQAFAQTYLHNSNPETTCGGTYYDAGGPGGNYPSNQFVTKTFTSTGNQRLRFNFQSFSTEQCCDWLQIWDGATDQATFLGQWQGGSGPGIITSTGNSLTFRFRSDGSSSGSGWAATIECAGPVLTEYAMGTGTINTCSGVFFDAGGRTGEYTGNQNLVQTFCSNNGQKIRFDFQQNNVFIGSNDTLFAYDGNGVNSSLLGAYVSGSRIETLISQGTCITFRFKSDATNTNGRGWQAAISCTTEEAPSSNTYNMSSGIRGVCNGIFVDDGGIGGNYSSNQFRTQTFRSLNGERLRFTFQQFSTEQCCDWLQIWDGATDQATFLGQWQGGSGPGIITSTGNSLTFRFRSDGTSVGAGFAAAIECFETALPEYNMSSGTTNTCAGVFFDEGGRNGNYTSNENRIQTFCSNNGQKIRFDFQQNNVFIGSNDTLFAYDGNGVNSSLLGAYVSGSRIETLISTGTCITFRFKSDAGNTNNRGWQAAISCTTEEAPAINTYSMSSGIRGVCSGIFADDGGLSGNYSSNQFRTQTFRSLNGQRLRFTFTQFSTEQCCDWLQIWDGPTDQGTFLGTWQGGSSPGIISSTGNSLTFRFRSDGTSVGAGFAAAIGCFETALPEYNMSSGTTNTCSGTFFDAGGRTGSYSSNENRTQTFCSNNGQRIQFDFANSSFFLGANDTLFAFDGNSVNAPLLGAFVSGSVVERLTSSGTCITFRFKSDILNTNDRGWQASISCTATAPGANVYTMSSGIRGVCSGTFTDNGGPSGSYTNNLFQTQTFQSLNRERLRFTFTQFSTEQCCDWIQIWDGPNTNSPYLGQWQGGGSPGVVTSTGSSLTFRFRSDGSSSAAGFSANIACFGLALTEYNMSSGTVSACSGAFYDSGGKMANYGSFENRVQTFCSDNGQKLKFEFNNNAATLQSGDTLFIYDGNTVNSTLKSILVGGSFFETIYSSGACFTFRFKSNNATAQGWASVFSCVTDAELTVYPMSSGLRVACEGIFADEGGLNGNYFNNSNKVQTFRSPNGERLRFVFNSFQTEGSNLDRLEIYDGPSSSWPLLTTLSGFQPAGLTITSTGNHLTFRFVSSSSSSFAGWNANIQCAGSALPNYNMSSGTVNTCEGVFYDHAGGGATYGLNENRVQTFCSNNQQRIVFDFTNFSLGTGDSLWAYDGNSILSRLIGIYVNSSRVEKLTSGGTCLTFRFKSDLQNSLDGWKALISCSPEPPEQVVYSMSTGLRSTCSGIFADQGGLNGNYFNNQNLVQIFQSESGQRIRFNFQQFSLENNIDFLRIYDGASINAPLIGTFTGTISPGIVVSTGNRLTFQFTSNSSSTTTGWAAAIDCFGETLPVYNMSAGTTNACSGAFYDNGGAEANYPIGENRIQTFCATGNNGKIQFNFNNLASRISTNDTLFVYDGNSITAPLVGYYINQSTIETLTSTGTCLTFRYKSDLNTSTVDQGWAAIISCVSEAPTNIVYSMSTGLRVVCSGIFADQGGLTGNYSNNTSQIQTFRSKNGERLRFDFSQFMTENAIDLLRIYDGPGTAFPLIGTYSGTNSPAIVLSSGSSLTFQFTSNSFSSTAGWAATIACAGPVLPDFVISNTPINACEGRWFDDGYVGNYLSARNYTQTICSPTGNRLVFNFNTSQYGFANGDSLFVFDGNTASSPLMAVLTGFGTVEPIVSSGNCITFRFRSLVAQNTGWVANFYCTDNPPQPDIIPMRSGIRVACSGIFTDDGGLNNNYSNNFSKRITFYSGTPGSRLQFNFQQFQLENGPDRIWIYDGSSVNSTPIGNYTGTNSPGIVTSTGNSLTFEFISNNNFSTIGWRAAIACVSNVPLVGTLTESPYCSGGGINIPFTSPTQSAGNSFTAQLSNANGEFSNPLTIGVFNSTTSGIINGNLPTGLTSSGNYRIRIIASNPATSGSPSVPFTIFATPAQPGIISGQTSLCPGTTFVRYTVANQSGNTGFSWTVPPGSNIVSGQGTNGIFVDFGSTSGTVSVVATNICGNSIARNLNINLQQGSTPTASVSSNATGNTVCQGNSISFTSTVTAGNNPQFQWFVNGNEFTGATGASLVLGNNFVGATVRLRVRSTSGCFNPSEIVSNEIAYTVSPTVEVSANITNSVAGASICQGQTVTFSSTIANGGNNPTYSWRINGQPFIGNGNSNFTASNLQNGDQVSLALTSSATCAAPNPAASNIISMVVNPVVTPSISISSNTGGNQTCAGNPIALSANANGGGSEPIFVWLLNGNIIPGANLPFYTTEDNLTGSNNFQVRITSSAVCATPPTVTSTNFQVTVVSAVAPSVTLSSNVANGPVCVGTSITFTANPVNGGTNPTYVWRVNGNVVNGQTGFTYTSGSITNNAQVTVEVNSSDPCASPASATSQPITVTLINSITPSVTSASNVSGNSICQGQNITFTATPTNGGISPQYQWTLNGTDVPGQTFPTFTTSNLSNNAQVRVRLTSSFSCSTPASVTSAPITVTVTNAVTPTASISSSQGANLCQGNTSALTAGITNGGSNPQYQWFLNGAQITGATLASYTTPTSLTGIAGYTVQLTSNANCANAATVTSQPFVITVNPTVVPAITFSSGVPGNAICTGTSITFTANASNGGTNPQYQWLVNGTVVNGQTNPTFTTSTLTNGQTVSIRLTSNANCASPATVSSATQTITVSPAVTPAVSANSNAQNNSICTGQNVIFTAAPTNGGTNPQYQWRLNGNAIAGETNATYSSSSLANNSQISVRLTSNAACANPETAISSSILITVSPAVTPTVAITSNQGNTICEGISITLTAGITNGGIAPAYQWLLSGNIIQGATSSTYPTPTSLSGTANYTVRLTSTANCASPAVITSQAFVLTLTPAVVPAVAVLSSVAGNTICQGQSVTFTANATNGGSNPAYAWLLNGNIVPGQTANTYINGSLANGNTVAARLTSNAICANPIEVTSALQTITVTPGSPAAVTVTSNTANNIICAGQTVIFTANPVNGGTTPAYVWRLNGNVQAGQTGATLTASSLASGDQITVVMTSNSTCANPNTATSPALQITISPSVAPAVNISSTPSGNSFCARTAINFSATPTNGGTAPTYEWRVNGNLVSGQNTSSFTLNLSATSSITATLVSNAVCANPATAISQAIAIGITAPPVVTAQNDTSVCEATGIITLRANPQGGVWSGQNVSSAGVFTPATPGNFKAYYNFTDPGTTCTGIDSVTITVQLRPNVSFPTQQPICANATPRQLSATPAGGVWNGTGVTSGGLFNPTLTGPGQQTVTYSVSFNNCEATRTLVIDVTPLLIADAGGNESICFSTQSVQFTGLPAGGTWSGNGVNVNGLFTPGFVLPGSTNIITYTVTVNGCAASATKQVTVSDIISPLTVNAGPDQTVCLSDGAFVLQGVIGAGGTWSGSGVSAGGVFNPIASGIGAFTLTYTVTFIQSPTCQGSDTKVVTVLAAPANPTTTGDTVCRQGMATLRATGGSNFRWFTVATGGLPIPGATGPNYTTPVLQASTTYYVSNIVGSCVSQRIPAFAYVNDFGVAGFALDGGNLVATPANGQFYQWLLNGAPVVGANLNTYRPTVSGDYSVLVRLDGCTVTSAVQFVVVTDFDVPIPFKPWKVYPNPVQNDLILAGDGIAEVRIMNLLGQEIKYLLNPQNESMSIDVRELPAGIYFVELKGQGKVEIVKVMVRR